MPRHVYKLIPDGSTWKLVNIEDVPASDPKVYVIEDTMDALEHPCDGQYYTSKRTFAEITKAHGCIEVGHRPGDRRSISMGTRQATYEAFSRAYDDLVAQRGPQ